MPSQLGGTVPGAADADGLDGLAVGVALAEGLCAADDVLVSGAGVVSAGRSSPPPPQPPRSTASATATMAR